MHPPIKTKFKQNDKVIIKETLFNENGWAAAQRGETMYVFGFTNIFTDRKPFTVYLLLSQDFFENKLGKGGIENYPDNSDIVLVREHEIELVK
jgi:hypothetical protein